MSLVLEKLTVPSIKRMPAQAKPAIEMTSLKMKCFNCYHEEMCLSCAVAESDVQRLDALKFGYRKVKMGQALYRDGERFQFIYIVRSGTFRSNLLLADGREQVNGFYMNGDTMGLDGIAYGAHASSATALEDAEVCVISYASLTEMTTSNTGQQQLLGRLMSRELLREHGLMMLLGSMNSEERLAAFLLNLSHRLQVRGYSASEFHLRMSRAEIGSYLGMTLETVSRTFSAFQQLRLLEVDKRFVRLTNLDGLRQNFGIRLH